MKRRGALLGAAAAAAALALPSTAPAQLLPYDFDPELAERPDEVRAIAARTSAGLPDLPLEEMTEVALDGPVRLWLYHEAAALLDRLVHAGRTDFAWPRDDESCAAHDGFALPATLLADPSPGCLAALDEVEAALSALDACREAAEPERYVLGYPPGVVDEGNTDDVLDLVGVMGRTLSELPPLYDGVLADDFVPSARDVLRKLRSETLLLELREQLASLREALALLEAHEGCFDAEALARLAGDVSRLVEESGAMAARIEALLRDGERESRIEALRLGAISRSRPALPFPALSQADRELLAFWIGAFYWRVRGGGLVDVGGTQEGRRLGLRRPYGVLGELAGFDDGVAAADGLYCEIFEGWGEWFDMGTTPGQDDEYHDLARMTERGREQVRTAVSGTSLLNPCPIPDYPFLLTVAGLDGKGYDTTWLYAGGLSMGPCYYFPWDRLLGWTWAVDVEPPWRWGIDGPTAIGEVCTGGSIALGLVRTLLRGQRLDEPPFAGRGAVFLVEPGSEEALACGRGGELARVTVIPLDDRGGPLAPGQEVTVVEDPPRVVGGGVESHTDTATGVTEYLLEVGSDRCSGEAPHEVRIRVGDRILDETVPLRFACPPAAEVAFVAEPALVAADGRSAASIRLEARDACGNPAFGRAVALEPFGDAPASLSAAEATTGDEPGGPGDGAASVEARSAAPGTMGLVATIEGRAFRSAPDLVTYLAPTPGEPGDGDGDGDADADAEPDGGGGAPGPGGCGCAAPGAAGSPLGPALLVLALGALRRPAATRGRPGTQDRTRGSLRSVPR